MKSPRGSLFGHGAKIAVCCAFALTMLSSSTYSWAQQADSWLRPQEVPTPANNVPNEARIALGKALFFDPRVSGSGFVSCASCHNPGLGWTDGLKTALGNGFHTLPRHTPTILNAAYSTLLMWDGRKKGLEDQALGPITSPAEMGMPVGDLIERLSQIFGYKPMFEAAYPGEGVSADTVAKAIASFERTVVSQTAPFDQWRMGDANAISVEAKHGFELFTGKANCMKCHSGFNFSDGGFHNIGLGDDDAGRYGILKLQSLRGAFKTPTLRDVALRAPYMHDGCYKTLAQVIDHYNRGGTPAPALSPDMQPLHLTKQEQADLVAFLDTLTSPRTSVAMPPLPR